MFKWKTCKLRFFWALFYQLSTKSIKWTKMNFAQCLHFSCEKFLITLRKLSTSVLVKHQHKVRSKSHKGLYPWTPVFQLIFQSDWLKKASRFHWLKLPHQFKPAIAFFCQSFNLLAVEVSQKANSRFLKTVYILHEKIRRSLDQTDKDSWFHHKKFNNF